MTFVTDPISEKYLHKDTFCNGDICCFHNPSDHHMNTWPLTVRHDRWCMTERICPHGCGHPDPDSVEWLKKIRVYEKAGGSVHGCDGCCIKPTIDREETDEGPLGRDQHGEGHTGGVE